MRAALLALVAAVGACSVNDVFVCARNEQCVSGGKSGRCEVGGACSFADPVCASGFRYAPLAPPELADECVGVVAADAAPSDGALPPDGASPPDGALPPDAPRPDAPRPDAPGTPADAGPDGAIVELVFPVAADTTLKSTLQTTNFGGAPELHANGNSVAILRFDVGAVGSRPVAAAFLHVTTTPSGGLDRGSVEVFRLLESWTESGATWKDRQTGVAWSNAGAAAPASRDGTILGSADPRVDDSEVVIAIPGSVVEGWARNAASNDGLVLQTRDEGPRTLALVSKEGTANKAAFLRVRLGP